MLDEVKINMSQTDTPDDVIVEQVNQLLDWQMNGTHLCIVEIRQPPEMMLLSDCEITIRPVSG